MNFKNKMTEIRRRHLAGVTRFISASVLALLFFLVILGRVLYAVLFDKEAELFSQSVEQVLIAVMTTLFFLCGVENCRGTSGASGVSL